MGSGALVITDNNPAQAEAIARDLAAEYWRRRMELEPALYTPAEAVAQGLRMVGGPVLLVETADCAGGGAACDSVATLKALVEAKVNEPAFLYVTDPQVATICHQAGVGRLVTVSLGHQLDPRWGSPLTVQGQVTRLSDGRFRYMGGIWDGVEGNMGPAAVLSIGAIQVLVTTFPTYDWMDEQFRSLQLDPTRAKFIVVKNPMNYRQAYGPYAKATFVLDTPGPTPATIRHVAYRRLQRPYFPVDADIPGLQPTILR
jgi:microcystin degradation protein MlrC